MTILISVRLRSKIYTLIKKTIMKKLFTLIAIVMFAFAANAQVTGYSVGEVVDNFTVTDTEGNVHSLYEYTDAGKYVYLDFFYSTCGPCQGAAPYFNEFYDKYGCNAGDVICISVNSGMDDNAAVLAFEETYGGDFHHTIAISNEGGCEDVATDFGINYYPTFCLIGPDQQLKEADIWPVNNVTTFEATFPAGFEPPVMECSATSIITENASDFTASVFPNPVSDVCYVNYQFESNKNYTLSIVNVLGQEVKTQRLSSINGEVASVNVDGLHSGLYIIQVLENNTSVADIKFHIER